jgi:hypothetical protein
MPTSDEIRIARLGARDHVAAARTFAFIAEVFDEGREPLSAAYVDRLLARPDFWAIAAFCGGVVVGGLTGALAHDDPDRELGDPPLRHRRPPRPSAARNRAHASWTRFGAKPRRSALRRSSSWPTTRTGTRSTSTARSARRRRRSPRSSSGCNERVAARAVPVFRSPRESRVPHHGESVTEPTSSEIS